MLQQLNWTSQAIVDQTLESVDQQVDLNEQSDIPKLNWTSPTIIDQTLKSVYQQADLDEQSDIPFLIRLFENPSSPIALPGKISLHDHDCLHILFGLGVSAQQEAFLIGFTMGNDDKTKSWHVKLFKFLSRFIYPLNYKFNLEELRIFDLGFEYGKQFEYRNLNLIEFKQFYELTVKELREFFGVDRNQYLGVIDTN